MKNRLKWTLALALVLSNGSIQCSLAFDGDKSVSQLTKIIKKNPQSIDAYQKRAHAYEMLGLYQKEIEDLTSVINIDPKNSISYEKRADVYYKIGEFQKAVADTTSATALNPKLSGGYRLAATIFNELGEYQKAIEYRSKLIPLYTMSALDYAHRANDYKKMGDLKLAQQDRLKAISLSNSKDRQNMQLCNPVSGDESKTITLDFKYDTRGHIYVPALVNGKPLQLMIDTGCEHSDIWKLAALSFTELDSAQLDRIKKLEMFQNEFLVVKDLKLGDMTFSNVPMSIIKGIDNHKVISGFLGGNILENFAVTIDYENKQILLSSTSDRHRATDEIVVPMILRHHRPYCFLTLNNDLKLFALMDTGCPSNLAPQDLVKSLMSKNFYFSSLTGGPSIPLMGIGYERFTKLSVGSYTIENPIFEIFASQSAPHIATNILIGNSFFSQLKTVTFDYPARQFILEPRKAREAAASLISEGKYFSAYKEEIRALDLFDRAMKLDSEFAFECHENRAQVFMYLNQYKNAIQEWNAAIKLDPNNFMAFSNRATCHREIKDYVGQIADDTAMIDLKSFNYPAYKDRAEAYKKLGQHKLAEKDRKMAEISYPKWCTKRY